MVNPPYKDFSESTTDRFRDLLVNMIAISSESQREAIISKLREYAEEFNTISGWEVGEWQLDREKIKRSLEFLIYALWKKKPGNLARPL